MGFAPASCDCLHKTGCNHHHVPKIDPFPILLQIRGAYIIRAFYGCMVTRGVLYANLTYWQDFFQHKDHHVMILILTRSCHFHSLVNFYLNLLTIFLLGLSHSPDELLDPRVQSYIISLYDFVTKKNCPLSNSNG